jgi:hypothetical protein
LQATGIFSLLLASFPSASDRRGFCRFLCDLLPPLSCQILRSGKAPESGHFGDIHAGEDSTLQARTQESFIILPLTSCKQGEKIFT